MVAREGERVADQLTVYEIGDGKYVYCDSVRLRAYQELEKLKNSTDKEEFKNGYRQALQLTLNWIINANVVHLENEEDEED